MLSAAKTAASLVVELPPVTFLPRSLRRRLNSDRLLRGHFAILLTLYLLVAIAATIEGTFFIPGGIGILQNPPFLAHIMCGALSGYLPIVMARRIASIGGSPEEHRILTRLLTCLRRSRLKLALYNISALTGLFALAYTVSMSAAPKANIYDSFDYPLTSLVYFAQRVYLYLVAYPFMVSGTLVLVHTLIRALRAKAAYYPFHPDEAGGLHGYLLAVDRPVYAVQSAAVSVALMNYIGWGGMEWVPTILVVAAPALATVFALLLLLDFNRLLAYKRRQEIRAVRLEQMQLYPAAKTLASLAPRECLELLEQIAAMEQLIDTIKRKRTGGWQKYMVNIGVMIATRVAAPAWVALVSPWLGSP